MGKTASNDAVWVYLESSDIPQPVSVVRCLRSHGITLFKAHAALCTLANHGNTVIRIPLEEVNNLTTELKTLGVTVSTVK